jgi:amino acid permease
MVGILTCFQPFLFIILYVGYKLWYKTRIQTCHDFEDAYFIPEFDKPTSTSRPRRGPTWKRFLQEAWSMV